MIEMRALVECFEEEKPKKIEINGKRQKMENKTKEILCILSGERISMEESKKKKLFIQNLFLLRIYSNQ